MFRGFAQQTGIIFSLLFRFSINSNISAYCTLYNSNLAFVFVLTLYCFKINFCFETSPHVFVFYCCCVAFVSFASFPLVSLALFCIAVSINKLGSLAEGSMPLSNHCIRGRMRSLLLSVHCIRGRSGLCPSPFTASEDAGGLCPSPFTASGDSRGLCPSPFTALEDAGGLCPSPLTASEDAWVSAPLP